MSGPTTAIIPTVDPVTVLIAAAAIRGAQAIHAGYAEAERLRDRNAVARDAQEAARSEAEAVGRENLLRQAGEAEIRFAELVALAERLGAHDHIGASLPARPASEEADAMTAYVRGLLDLIADLQRIILSEAARQQREVDPGDAGLAVPAASARAEVPLPPGQRLLARIAHLGPLPEDLAGLARELDAAPNGERADLIAMELRRRIQSHIEELQQREVKEALALVLEQSLQDLGYQVEEIAETLFVEGGVTHFRKPGWGDYQVRLRVDARTATTNFNVIRAVDAGQQERSALDHLAEDRWCAEFPALLRALEARGVILKVTRRLAAGELPVQLVDRAKLPHFADEEEARHRPQLRSRELP